MKASKAFLFVFLIALPLCLVNTQPVKSQSSGTIYIRADGSVEGTDKIQREGNVYTFTDNINETIIIERDNTVVNGAGYTLQGDGKIGGIWLENRCNVTIKNMQISHLGEGIRLMGTRCKNNIIIGNNITDNGLETYGNGIWLTFGASHTTICGNNITGNWVGVFVYMGGDNIISENYITANRVGVWLYGVNSSIIRNDIMNNGRGVWDSVGSNIIYHNNFVNNTIQADIDMGQPVVSIWDDGYPSGGNYWSDYNNTDFFSGPFQNETSSDGIADTQYVIDSNNQDSYPLMGMFSDFTVWNNETYHIITICNFTISDFNWGYNMNITGTWEKALYFNVFGPADTVGFCRIMIPRAFMEGPYTVLFTNEVNSTELPISNSTHVFLYITYNHSGHVMIIPEFPTWTPTLLLLVVLTVAIAIYKRRLLKTPKH